MWNDKDEELIRWDVTKDADLDTRSFYEGYQRESMPPEQLQGYAYLRKDVRTVRLG